MLGKHPENLSNLTASCLSFIFFYEQHGGMKDVALESQNTHKKKTKDEGYKDPRTLCANHEKTRRHISE